MPKLASNRMPATSHAVGLGAADDKNHLLLAGGVLRQHLNLAGKVTAPRLAVKARS